MRILLKILMSLVTFVSFLALLVFGAFYAYGQFGVPLVTEQIAKAEAQAAEEIESQYPGSTVDVKFEEVYYQTAGGDFALAIQIHATAELAGVEVADKTQYAILNLMAVVMNGGEYETYDQEEWDTLNANFEVAPSYVFNGEEAKKMAITYLIISGAVFVGSILINKIVLRKRRLAR